MLKILHGFRYIEIELADLKERFGEIREQASFGAQDYFNDISALQQDDGAQEAKVDIEDSQEKLDLLALTVDTVATHMFTGMINETKAALTRALKLSAEDERQENSKKISEYLIMELKTFLMKCLTIAKKQIPTGTQKSSNEFQYFDIVTNVSRVVHLLRTKFEPHIFSHFGEWLVLRDEVLKQISTFIGELQVELQEGLTLGLKGMTKRVENVLQSQTSSWSALLSKQSPADSSGRTGVGTEPCECLVAVINDQKRFIMASLSGRAQLEYLRAYGSKLYAIFLDYFPTFKVELASAAVLLGDFKRLAESVSDFNVPVVNQKFDILLALANIFTVKATNLPSVMNEGLIGQVDLAIRYKYVECRSDFESAGVEGILSEANIMKP